MWLESQGTKDQQRCGTRKTQGGEVENDLEKAWVEELVKGGRCWKLVIGGERKVLADGKELGMEGLMEFGRS